MSFAVYTLAMRDFIGFSTACLTGRRPLAGLGVVLLLACSPAVRQAREDKPPEESTGRHSQTAVFAQRHLVVAANPLAAAAGVQVLRRGGSAIDAAIAVQAVLGLVEPQSSGIGGGALLLYYQADTRQVHAFDGRETAPAKTPPDVFVKPDGAARDFYDAALGGTAVGVPGALRMLELVHKKYGKRPWAELFEPAIQHADQGFPVSPRLHMLLKKDRYLRANPAAASYFYKPDGTPVAIGERLVNRPFAAALRKIAGAGAGALYRGELAQDIVTAVQQAAHNPGTLSLDDLARYEAKERPPVCLAYRSQRVCSFGPPSSGGVTLLEELGMLEHFSLATPDGSSLHLMMEASRLAFADRNRYLADADFVSVPVAGLLSPAYLQQRASLIQPGRSLGAVQPGEPPAAPLAQEDGASPERPATSHMVLVDDDGNVVSMTTSIEDAFGSRILVDGFLLNNQMTDFSFVPVVEGKQVANRVEPGKRPRSSMTPVIVLDPQGRFSLAVGSAGGPWIIGYVLRSLVAVIDWHLDIQSALNLPHVVNRNGDTELEDDPQLQGVKAYLQAHGHVLRTAPLTSGMHGLMRRGDGYQGGADPRREGAVLGD